MCISLSHTCTNFFYNIDYYKHNEGFNTNQDDIIKVYYHVVSASVQQKAGQARWRTLTKSPSKVRMLYLPGVCLFSSQRVKFSERDCGCNQFPVGLAVKPTWAAHAGQIYYHAVKRERRRRARARACARRGREGKSTREREWQGTLQE